MSSPLKGPTSLSVSQIQDYSGCGKRWQLKKVLKIPFAGSIAMQFGKALHAGLEAFNYEHFSTGRVESRLIGDKAEPVDMLHVLKIFKEELNQQVTEPALADEYEKVQRQKNSRKALKVLNEAAFKTHMQKELLAMGESLLTQYSLRTDLGDESVFIEKEDSVEIRGLPFRFIADLVDKKDGKVRLIDYKSRAKSDTKIAEMQLTAYAQILADKYSIKVDEIYQMNFIKSASKPRIEVLTYEIASLETNVAVFDAEVASFIDGVTKGVFPRNMSAFCSACDVFEVCRNPHKEAEALDKLEKDASALFDTLEV